MPNGPHALRTLRPDFPHVLRALLSDVPRALHALVVDVPCALVAHVPGTLRVSLHAQMSYVLSCLTYLVS